MINRSSDLALVIPRVASRPVVGTLAALAFLLQAIFTLPLAVRMAAETPCWAQIDSAMLHMDHHAMSHMDHQRPTTPQAPHPHDRCPVCHGSPASFGTLAIALILVIAVFVAPPVARSNCNSSPNPHPSSRFGTYRSRAPPASA